ncbi:MAG TPA: GNAT family N-acetyltransferase [Stellaceae bacterium]|nr:GNAT family N-acetyltransferase [Stellaceae bacterium]
MSRRIEPIPEAATEALAVLHCACFPDDPWEAPALARIMALSGGFGWLAWEEDELAGFILVRDLGNECEILSFGVTPRWRRRGIAQALLRTAIDEAAGRSLPSVVLEVAIDNDPARELYLAAGFTVVGRRARYYRRPDGRVDALVLRLALPRQPVAPYP